MEHLIRILINRLVSKGIDVRCIPSFMRNLVNTIAATPDVDRDELNSRLRSLGWEDFELDDYTLALVSAVWESEFGERGPIEMRRGLIHKDMDGSVQVMEMG